jgi:hypothetical protein
MTEDMKTYRCPTDPVYCGDGEYITGCGETFTATPDREGLVDCPHCGIWFSPRREPATDITTPAAGKGGR